MAYFYKAPKKPFNQNKKHILNIEQESQLRLAIQSKDFTSVTILNMRNSNISDSTTKYFSSVISQLMLQKIDISENFSFITDQSLFNLSNCRFLTSLLILNISDNEITDKGIQILCKSPNFMKLKQLIAFGNSNITSNSLRQLSDSEYIKNLNHIDFHATSISDEGMFMLFNSDNCSQLQIIDISMNWEKITDRTLLSFGDSKFCTNLKKLNIEDCYMTNQGIHYLSESINSRNIHYLNVSNSQLKNKIKQYGQTTLGLKFKKKVRNEISDQALKSLAFSKNFINLKSLFLKSTQITSQGIKYIASSSIFQKLQVLKISQCPEIDNEALIYIGNMLQYSNLSKLHINSTSVTTNEAKKFEQKYPKVNIIY